MGVRQPFTLTVVSVHHGEFIELLKFYNQKYEQTLIVITHDESIARQADRILTIEDGRIVRDEKLGGSRE